MEVIQTFDSIDTRTSMIVNADNTETTTTEQLFLAPDLSKKWPLLDAKGKTTIPYSPPQAIIQQDGTLKEAADEDTPLNVIEPGFISYLTNDAFTDYLMYKPSGGIWVPVGMMSWGWSAEAQNINPEGAGWIYAIKNPVNPNVTSDYAPSDTWPIWHDNGASHTEQDDDYQVISTVTRPRASAFGPFKVSLMTPQYDSQPGQPATYELALNRDDGQGDSGGTYPGDLTVYFNLSGNVQDGVDYTVDFGSYPGYVDPGTGEGYVTLPAGQGSACLGVDVLNDSQWTDDGQWSDGGQRFLALSLEDDSAEMGGQPSYSLQNSFTTLTFSPTLAPIADQTTATNSVTQTVTLQGEEPEGNTLTYSAQAETLPYFLEQTYGLQERQDVYETSQLDQGAEYLVGTSSANGYATSSLDGFSYYLLPSGDLYEQTPPYDSTALVGVLVVHLGAAFYNDPTLLTGATNDAVPVVLTVAGNQLTIAPESGYTGIFVVIASASDGQTTSSASFKVNVIATASSASFVGTDTTTGGDWRSAYGGDGFDIAQDSSGNSPDMPSYAQVSISGQNNWTWPDGTTGLVPLDNAAGTGTILACWTAPGTMEFYINLTDGQTHQVTLYSTNPGASQQFDVLDATTGITINTETLAGSTGMYITWELTGDVIIRVTNLGPDVNANINAIFFGGAASAPTAQASFLGADTTTGGDWRSAYGGDGFDIAQDSSGNSPDMPSYAQVSISGQNNWTWPDGTTGLVPLDNAAGTGTILACWTAPGTMEFHINLTDGQTHQVTLYSTNPGASQQFDVLDATTGITINTETLAGSTGMYITWELTGDVIIRVTNLGPDVNANINAIFFGGAASAPTAQASFLGADTTTGGDWRSAYGGDGFDIAQDSSGNSPDMPSYAQVSISGQNNWTWPDGTTGLVPLDNAAGTGTILACWTAPGTMEFHINLTDGQTHQVTLYSTNPGASQQFDVLDATTGITINTETLAGSTGMYVTWELTGDVIIRVTNLGPDVNANINAIFFGGAASAPTAQASFLGADTTTGGDWRSAYGGDGFDIAQDSSGNSPDMPSYAQVSISGQNNWTWPDGTTGLVPLDNAAGTGTILACWTAPGTMEFHINLTDGQTHQVTLYSTNPGALQQFDVLDATTGITINTETLAGSTGMYVTWELTGDVIIRVTNLGPDVNANINAIFFGGAVES